MKRPPKNWAPFGSKLSQHVKELGYTQEEIAKLLDVAYPTLLAWLSGRNVPSTPHHQRLVATFLGWTLEEFRVYLATEGSTTPEEKQRIREEEEYKAHLRGERRWGKRRRKKTRLKEV